MWNNDRKVWHFYVGRKSVVNETFSQPSSGEPLTITNRCLAAPANLRCEIHDGWSSLLHHVFAACSVPAVLTVATLFKVQAWKYANTESLLSPIQAVCKSKTKYTSKSNLPVSSVLCSSLFIHDGYSLVQFWRIFCAAQHRSHARK